MICECVYPKWRGGDDTRCECGGYIITQKALAFAEKSRADTRDIAKEALVVSTDYLRCQNALNQVICAVVEFARTERSQKDFETLMDAIESSVAGLGALCRAKV